MFTDTTLIHELAARVPIISAASRGPVVNLVGWTTIVTMCLAVFTVLISKAVMFRRLGWNDIIITLAMVRAR